MKAVKRLFCLLVVICAYCLIASVASPPVIASGEWEIIRDTQIRADLYYVRFFDENTGVAYGTGNEIGYIMMTRDGGQTWSKKELYGNGMFLSPDEGVFISPRDKMVHNTDDGGRTWDSFRIRSDANSFIGFMDMHFVSLDEGWAVGAARQGGFLDGVVHTVDGGETWEKQWDSKGVADVVLLGDMYFLDSKTGWVSGMIFDDGNMRNLMAGTTDGGETWFHTFWEPIKRAQLSTIFFASKQVGWAVGHDGIFHTADGGHTWEVQSEESAYGLHFLDEKQGWAVQSEFLLHTLDGGETWTKEQINTPSGLNLWGVYFINEKEGWVVGTSGLVMHTQDGGETWEIQTDYGFDGLQAVDFISPKWGVAVGNEILFTEDGLNWQNPEWATNIPDDEYFSHVDFVDKETGWLAGSTLRRTEDAGNTWEELGASAYPSDICFIDLSRGWMVDNGGNILFTDDGGKTWTIISVGGVGIGESFTKVTFMDEDNGWATSLFGQVYRTEDGGHSWKLIGQLPAKVPNGISFANEREGWTTTYVNGLNSIFHTEDGGENWHLDAKIQSTFLSDICYDGGESVYVVGSYGVIARYTDPSLADGKYAVEAEGKMATQWANQKMRGGINGYGLPNKTQVYQNYPNPFNPETWIPYQLKMDSAVTVSIYNSIGQIVRTLAPGHREAGSYLTRDTAAYWDGKNQQGEPVNSGVYFYKLVTDDGYSFTRKMLIVR